MKEEISWNGRDEYCEAIKDIMRDERMDVNQKLDELERLYQWKPVRAEWFLAKARLLVEKEGRPEIGYATLKGMYFSKDDSDVAMDMLDFLAELDLMRGDAPMAACRRFQIDLAKGNETEVVYALSKVLEAESDIMQQWDGFKALADSYLVCCKYLNYEILRMYSAVFEENAIPDRDCLMEEMRNVGFLREAVEGRRRVAIFVDVPGRRNEAFIMGRCLSKLGCQVYVMDASVQMELDEAPNMADMAAVSMDNGEETYGFTLIPVIECVLRGESLGDDSEYILDRLCRAGNVIVLASEDRFEGLSETKVMRNRIDNLVDYDNMLLTDYMAFGWAGSYLEHISILYGMDAGAAVAAEAKCRFSVVIPVRNSVSTLQYTLRTCLNQRYQGDFEIVISDNSTEGNTEVFEFCRTIEDKRVRYYRTPRNLPLTKSFEYAFLQTRGEYIFSLGADDAMLPWTLEVWDKIVRKYPEEEIFLWDRGFYAWPGFNGSQQHQFIIPGRYRSDNIKCGKREPIQYLALALSDPQNMYLLPMLYINSGFRRDFMRTLLDETGRMWDGGSQDLYIGVMVSVLKRKIIKIDYPLTIAGMSSASVGALSSRVVKEKTDEPSLFEQIKRERSLAVYSRSGTECLVPLARQDVFGLYTSVLRVVKRGAMPRRYLKDVFDWKKWYLNGCLVMDCRDIYYDVEIRRIRCASKRHGKEFFDWVEESICSVAYIPKMPVEEAGETRAYQEEDTESGLVIDASKYGVQNVYDASLLFEELIEDQTESVV